ncbi:MAG: hypothetical protein ACXWLE_09300 [Rhizomicrobium sp.]
MNPVEIIEARLAIPVSGGRILSTLPWRPKVVGPQFSMHRPIAPAIFSDR